MRFLFPVAMLLCMVSRAIGLEKVRRPIGNWVVFSRDDGMRLGMQRRSSRSLSGKLAKSLRISSPGKLLPKKMAFKGPSKDFDTTSPSSTKAQTSDIRTADVSKPNRLGTVKAPSSKSTADQPIVKKNEAPQNTPAQSPEPDDKLDTTAGKKKEDSQENSSPISTLFNGAKKAFNVLKPESTQESNSPSETSPEVSNLLELKHEDPADLVRDESQETEGVSTPSTSA